MNNTKVYRIPPKLNRQFLICGLNMWECLIIIIGILISAISITKGLITPTVLTILFFVIRSRLFDERNAYDELKIRFRHFYADNVYSINDKGGRKTK